MCKLPCTKVSVVRCCRDENIQMDMKYYKELIKNRFWATYITNKLKKVDKYNMNICFDDHIKDCRRHRGKLIKMFSKIFMNMTEFIYQII